MPVLHYWDDAGSGVWTPSGVRVLGRKRLLSLAIDLGRIGSNRASEPGARFQAGCIG